MLVIGTGVDQYPKTHNPARWTLHPSSRISSSNVPGPPACPAAEARGRFPAKAARAIIPLLSQVPGDHMTVVAGAGAELILLAFKYFYLFIVFGCAGSSLPRGLFSRWGERGRLSGCGTQASHCSSFSCCGARALGCVGSVVAQRLSCSTARGIFPDPGSSPCLLHWQADSLPLSHLQSSLSYETSLLSSKHRRPSNLANPVGPSVLYLVGP